MVCHVQLCSTVCIVQRLHDHSTVDVIRLCVLSKGHDRMWRPTSSYHMCSPRAIIATTSYVVRPYVFLKGYYGMLHQTLSDCVCILRMMMSCYARRRLTVCNRRAMMAFHARRHPTICDVQELHGHAKLDFVRSCVLFQSDDGMPSLI